MMIIGCAISSSYQHVTNVECGTYVAVNVKTVTLDKQLGLLCTSFFYLHILKGT